MEVRGRAFTTSHTYFGEDMEHNTFAISGGWRCTQQPKDFCLGDNTSHLATITKKYLFGGIAIGLAVTL